MILPLDIFIIFQEVKLSFLLLFISFVQTKNTFNFVEFC